MQHTEHSQQKKQKPDASRAAKGAAQSAKHDVISLLSEDHKRVRGLFKEFEKLHGHKNSDDKKKALVQEICMELTIHAKAEEELFYPAARDNIKDQDMLDEAYVEHAGAKELIQQLQSMHPGDEFYDAKVTVLQEYIEHHIKEEESKIFPMIKKAKMDVDALGEKIFERKEELQGDQGEVSMSMLSKS